MEDPIKQAFEKIEKLRDGGSLKKAYELCLQIIQTDPENSRAVRLLKKLEGEIRNANLDSIKKNIKSLEPLWEREKYEELVQKYHKLYELAPNYEPLEGLIAKAEDKLKEKLAEQKEKFVENFKQELEKMFERGEYGDLILKTSQTQAAYPSNKQIAEIGRAMRTKIVGAELKKNTALLKSHNYPEIIKFLEKLRAVEPTFKKTEKLIRKYKKKGLTDLTDEQQEFVYRGLTHTETLLQLKKYEKAAEAASEILETDPKNTAAEKILKKAERKAKKQIRKEVIAKMKESFPALKKEYKEKRESFIRI